MPPSPITRAEISHSRLAGNFERLRSLARRTSYGDQCDLLAVVKADAYGHDASICAPFLVETGATWLGVTSVQEGIAVRRLCPDTNILVMSGLLSSEIDAHLNAKLVPTIWSLEHLNVLAEAVRCRAFAVNSIPVHLEIDTGMSRQGVSFTATELGPVLNQLKAIPALRLDGVFTHFASSEMLDAEQNRNQLERFQQAVEQILTARFCPRWLHAGNSSTLLGQQMLEPLAALARKLDAKLLLRPGLALYGYALPLINSKGASIQMPVELQPVLAWKTVIVSMRTVEAGAEVGYNATFTASKDMRLALLPVGYADGLNRKLSSRQSEGGGYVLVRGVAAPIVGRISMDLTVIDISNIQNVVTGDEVILLGEQGDRRVTAEDHARWAETIPYEILCALNSRVPRVACE